MSLFDRSFLITTGITAVICGALFYYFNTRVRELELALVRQSQVLSSFISNVQQEFRAGSKSTVVYDNELASPEAIRAVNEEHKKIVISDSECDSDDDDDDNESVSDNDSVSDNESVSDNDEPTNIKVEDIPLDDTHNKLVVCDLPSVGDTNTNDDIRVIDMSLVDNVLLSDEDEDENSDDDESDNEFEHVKDNIKIGNLNIKVEKLNPVEKLDSLDVTNVDATEVNATEVNVDVTDVNVDANTNSLESYNDLKVDELRKIVVDKGLAKKEEAKKLKKNELLTTLLEKATF